MTHDLLKNILDELDVRIERIVISDLREEVYYARVQLKTEKGTFEIDARPSDAIAGRACRSAHLRVRGSGGPGRHQQQTARR